jgi:Uma2 family endonuclease
MVNDINQLDFSKKYTYADYLTWKFKERVELLKGYIFKMSPVPSLKHQDITGEIFVALKIFMKGKDCKVFIAPFDVRLPIFSNKKNQVDTVVQPDICVVCDLDKLDKQGCNGAPDLVIEVLSPGNTKNEMKDKFKIYQDSGVLEYWLVEPEQEFVVIYNLDAKGKYIGSQPFIKEDKIKSKVISGFELDLSEVF